MAHSLSRKWVKGRFSTNGKSREVAIKATAAHMARTTEISGRISRHLPCHKGALLSISKVTLLKIQGSIILLGTPSRQTIRLYFVNSSREILSATRVTFATMLTVLTTFSLQVLRCRAMCRLTKLLSCTMGTYPNNKFLTHPCSLCRHPR